MDLVPQRQSLLAQSTAILRDALCSGEWGRFMPGERKLCEQMQIGRDTLRLALKQLEREGLLAPGEPGKRREILASPAKAPKRGAEKESGMVAYLSPFLLEALTATSLLEIDVLRESLGGAGLRLEVIGSAAFGMARPGKTLQKLVAEHKSAAWVLHQSTAPMQRWFHDNGIPCLLHGQPQEGVELPYVDVDYEAVARHAGGVLIRNGHRRVVLLRPGARLRGLEMAEAGLRSAFASHTAAELDLPTIAYEGPDKASLVAKLAEVLGAPRDRPTALVATRARQVLTIVSWLGSKGLVVSRDVSVLALDHSPNMDHLVPDIACYQTDAEQVAKTLHRKVIEVAGAGATARSPQPLMPEFFPGGSVAKLR